MPTPAKPAWQSWTIWFNLLALVYGGLVETGVLNAIPAPWGPIILSAGNLLLRTFKTTGPVTFTS
jgi:hypothetical protein